MKKILSAIVSCLAFAGFLLTGPASAQDKTWRPVSPEALQLKTAKVEAGADAEVLLWEVRVVDGYDSSGIKTTLDHYLRLKIFTVRGRDDNGKVDIPFGKLSDHGIDIVIKDIAARTIKADGTIVELKPDAIFEREMVKGKGIKLKAKSFVVPAIEVGAIIEYRWKEIQNNSLSFYTRLEFARELPVQFVKYYVKPLDVAGFDLRMRLHSFNVDSNFVKESGGFYSVSMENVPSFTDEPSMPGEYRIRPWVLVFYDDDSASLPAAEYWRKRGRKVYTDHSAQMKPTEEIRRTANKVAGDGPDDLEKVRRIFEFTRASVKDVNDDAAEYTPEQKKAFKENKNPSDTLKRGYGNWHDINMLFGAMLDAIGLDVRVANAALRDDPVLDTRIGNYYLVRSEIIAAKVDDQWRFFDPSRRYEPWGGLCWCEEGQSVLISDSNEPFWSQVPFSGSEKTKQKRKASLRLTPEGAIEGDVRIEYTGHLAQYYKEYNDDLSVAERERSLIEAMKQQISADVEVTQITIENVQDLEKPFTYLFKIRVPGYVERTGKRLFLQPNVFQRSAKARFVASARRYDVAFDYAWSENDEINIKLPPGYVVEGLGAIPDVTDWRSVQRLAATLSVSEDKSELLYRRSFLFGNDGMLEFDRREYDTLRDFFSRVQKADQSSVSLVKE